MATIKIARKIDFLLTTSYEYDLNKDLVIQKYKFWVSNKKYLKYAFDKRFALKKKIEKILKDNLLNNFKERNDNEDNIEMIYFYKKQDIPKSKTFNVEFYMPPFNGCKYCTKAKMEGDFIYCLEKKKHYDCAGIKNCKVFDSIEEILT